jgi:hypothetical protein
MRRPKKAPAEILSTPHGFCEGILGFPVMCPWQLDTLTPFAEATGPEARLIHVGCASRNEGGGEPDRSRISRVATCAVAKWRRRHRKRRAGPGRNLRRALWRDMDGRFGPYVFPNVGGNRPEDPDLF